MKTIVLIFFVLFVFSSCLEFPEKEGYVPIVLKSATGFSSEIGEIYVQRSIGVGLEIATLNEDIKVISAIWKIEDFSCEGLQISYKFDSLGEISLSVEALLSSGATVKKDFIVNVVEDISLFDPIIIKSLGKKDGKTEILFLFLRERLRYAVDSVYYYIGNMTDWKNVMIYPESYIINDDNEVVLSNDVGKYLGFKLILADGNYEIAIVHSQDIWTDFSGSLYVKNENPCLIKFAVRGSDIDAMGNMPGIAGDAFFRFTQNVDKVDLYFKLDEKYSSNAFYTYQLVNGDFSQPILLFSVDEYQNWGRAELESICYIDRVIVFRFGSNQKNFQTFSDNMKKSSYFSAFSQGIEIQFKKI